MSYLHDWRPDITLEASQTLVRGIALVHSLLLVLLPFTTLAWHWSLPVALLLAWQWRYLHRRYGALTCQRAVRRVLWATDGWMIEDGRGMQGPYRLCGGTRVMKDILVLHFRRDGVLPWGLWGRSIRVPVVRDNIADTAGDERFHLMQIFLRWQRPDVLNPRDADS